MTRTRFKLVGGLIAGLCLIAAAPSQAATYPAGKSTFEGGTQGWTVGDTFCFPGKGGGLICNARGEHSPLIGNPGGSIAARVEVTANYGAGFFGVVIWNSPTFSPPQTPKTANLTYDRLIDPGGILNIEGAALIRFRLFDVASNNFTTLSEERLIGPFDSTKWVNHNSGFDPALLQPGHTYQLRLETAITSSRVAVGVIGSSFVRYDNVGLVVQDPACCGVSNSPQVQIVRGPVSNTFISNTLKGLKWFAEFGNGPGGSLVPTKRCTIIGTPGNDRITGSPGNDVICGRGGNDRINGRGGRDIIDGGNGNDKLKGGSGNDVILGLRGRDTEAGGSGNDKLGGGAKKDKLAGGSGKDNLNGGSAADRLRGQSGNDRLKGGKGKDRLFGGKGKDRLLSRDGNRERINGGPGRDKALVDRKDAVIAVEVIL
jgi:Ca2+-binding RTX toxin-like protein